MKINRVVLPLVNGFEELEAITIIDVLRRGGVEVILASLESELIISGAHNIEIKAETTLEKLHTQKIDMVILSGGWDALYHLGNNRTLKKLLLEMNEQRKYIVAIGEAPSLLAKFNLLKKCYTCHPAVQKEMKRQTNAHYTPECDFVLDDTILTSKGVGTTLPFALALLQKLEGNTAYEITKNQLLINTV